MAKHTDALYKRLWAYILKPSSRTYRRLKVLVMDKHTDALSKRR